MKMMTKRLTLEDLYRELGQLMAVDGQEISDAMMRNQRLEQTELHQRHDDERKAMKAELQRRERKMVELREAIRLVREQNIEPMQAVMQSKGRATQVRVGHGDEKLWVMPDEDDGA